MTGLSRLKQLTKGTAVYLGLDLSKTKWHVTVRAEGETLAALVTAGHVQPLEALLNTLQHCRVHSVYEAGPLGYGLHDWLSALGVDSMVCSPGQVPVEAGNRVKTDRRDSLKLATLLEAGLLRPIAIPTPQQRAARELVRQRERLVRHRRRAMVQLKAFLLTYGITPEVPGRPPWTKRFLTWLEDLKLEDRALQTCLESLRRQYLEVDQHLRDHTGRLKTLAETRRFASQVELLSSVPGIGWLTALTFAVEVFNWSRFATGEGFSAWLGLTPAEYSSGERIRHGRISRTGNARLRALLVESCWNTIKKDDGLRHHYESIKRRRGAKRAIVAIARKMCHRILAMMKTGALYQLPEAA